MRYIKGAAKNFIANSDIELIAKEMVNVFHRTEYYDIANGGIEVNNPKHNKYFKFEVGTMEYNISPHRGYIYINCNEIYRLNKTISVIKHNLTDAFNHFNKWGKPTYIYTHFANTDKNDIYNFENYTPTQLVTQEVSSENYDNIYVTDTDLSGGNTKNNYENYIMAWQLITKKNAVRYVVDGNYLSIQELAKSPSLVVLDLNHTLIIPHGFFSINYPPLPNKIKAYIVNTIDISPKIGIDVHIYNTLVKSNKHPGKFSEILKFAKTTQVYMYDGQFKDLWVSLDTTNENPFEFLKEKNKQMLMPAPSDSSSIPVEKKTKKVIEVKNANEKYKVSICNYCGIDLFDSFYLMKLDAAQMCVCKFCAHFNSKIHAHIQKFNGVIMRIKHPIDTIDKIRTLDLDPKEIEILDTIQKGIMTGNKIHANASDPLINALNLSYTKEVIKYKNVIGISNDDDINDVINDAYLLPEGTVVFKYSFW